MLKVVEELFLGCKMISVGSPR